MSPASSLRRLSLSAACAALALTTSLSSPAQDPAQVDAAAAEASAHLKPDRIVPYKTVGPTTLTVSIFNPPGHRPDRPVAGLVFFHGGGFNIGAPANFYAQARYLARRGLVAICVEYRIRTRHGTTQREAIQDAFSAMRWVRRHVGELGLDPKRLGVAGGSAGGYLAAAVTTLSGLDEPGEDTSVSPRADALVLFNANPDRGPDSRGFAKVQEAMGDQWRTISPLHNLYRGFPPTIHFLGRADQNIPVSAAQKAQAAIEQIGGRCDLHLYDGQEHGFFNYGRGDNTYFRLTLLETDRFLASIGFLSGPPNPADPIFRR